MSGLAAGFDFIFKAHQATGQCGLGRMVSGPDVQGRDAVASVQEVAGDGWEHSILEVCLAEPTHVGSEDKKQSH